MVLDLSPFRTIVGIKVVGTKYYRVAYSYRYLGKELATEYHTLYDPADPRTSGNAGTQARIDGWHQNRLDELLAVQIYQVVEILESSKTVQYKQYAWLDGISLRSGLSALWTLILRFSYTFEGRGSSSVTFASEVDGADWADHVPLEHRHDLRLEDGPHRV